MTANTRNLDQISISNEVSVYTENENENLEIIEINQRRNF